MKIQLKQSELIQAIRGYITQQGIALAGKSVTVDFTAGRGSSGVSADINIEEGGGLPNLEADEAATGEHAPTLTLATDAGAPVQPPAPVDEEAAPAPATTAPAVSLFD